jgi:hypothetical protein
VLRLWFFSAALSGCAGEAMVKYWGTVSEGARTTYSFDDGSTTTAKGPPIVGAIVFLGLGRGSDCAKESVDRLQAEERNVRQSAHPWIVTTDSQGHFTLSMLFGQVFFDNSVVILCAEASGYTTFAHEVLDLRGEEPTLGQRPIQIILAPDAKP